MWTRPLTVVSVLGTVLAVAFGSTAQVPTCRDANPVITINTLGKGGGASENAIVSTDVTGNIVGAAELGPTASRIPVCAGTDVRTDTTDASGTATVTKTSRGVSCDAGAHCRIRAIGGTEKYTVRSADGTDTDTLSFVPQ